MPLVPALKAIRSIVMKCTARLISIVTSTMSAVINTMVTVIKTTISVIAACMQ